MEHQAELPMLHGSVPLALCRTHGAVYASMLRPLFQHLGRFCFLLEFSRLQGVTCTCLMGSVVSVNDWPRHQVRGGQAKPKAHWLEMLGGLHSPSREQVFNECGCDRRVVPFLPMVSTVRNTPLSRAEG